MCPKQRAIAIARAEAGVAIIRHIVAAPYTLRLVINREQGRLAILIFPFGL